MARKKRLNVLNSQKIFNLNIVPRKNDYVDVYPDNYKGILQSLKDDKSTQDPILKERNGVEYRVFYDDSYDYEFYTLLVEVSENFLLVSNTSIPVTLIDLLSSYPRFAQVMYLFTKEYTQNQIDNILQASAGVKVSILYSTDSSNGFILKRSLYPLKYSANELVIHWIGDNYEEEYELFTSIRNALSGWGIVITIEYKNDEEREYLFKRKEEDAEIKQSSYVWGRE